MAKSTDSLFNAISVVQKRRYHATPPPERPPEPPRGNPAGRIRRRIEAIEERRRLRREMEG